MSEAPQQRYTFVSRLSGFNWMITVPHARDVEIPLILDALRAHPAILPALCDAQTRVQRALCPNEPVSGARMADAVSSFLRDTRLWPPIALVGPNPLFPRDRLGEGAQDEHDTLLHDLIDAELFVDFPLAASWCPDHVGQLFVRRRGQDFEDIPLQPADLDAFASSFRSNLLSMSPLPSFPPPIQVPAVPGGSSSERFPLFKAFSAHPPLPATTMVGRKVTLEERREEAREDVW